MSQRFVPLAELRRIRELPGDPHEGDAVLSALAAAGTPAAGRVHKLAVEEVPVCGSNDEVLRHHRLDGDGVAERVAERLGAR